MGTTDTYALGRSEAETRRLILQHQIYASISRRFFEAAGIGAGIKVLDLGSGAGDVALLMADLVGPRGQVVGVDMNPAILETARARAASVGFHNVSFHAGDVREVITDTDFDAVVGRWVLMYVPEPAALLRHLVTRLLPGGIVAFHENDFSYPPTTFPATPIVEQLRAWMAPPPGRGPEMAMGTKLYGTYLDAGLPAPQLMLEAPIGGGPGWLGYEYVAETFRSLAPMIQQISGIDPAKFELDTLAERFRNEVEGVQGIQMLPMMIGAWSRKKA